MLAVVQILCRRVYTPEISDYQAFYIEKCRVQTISQLCQCVTQIKGYNPLFVSCEIRV